jgi:hypothetical protein
LRKPRGYGSVFVRRSGRRRRLLQTSSKASGRGHPTADEQAVRSAASAQGEGWPRPASRRPCSRLSRMTRGPVGSAWWLRSCWRRLRPTRRPSAEPCNTPSIPTCPQGQLIATGRERDAEVTSYSSLPNKLVSAECGVDATLGSQDVGTANVGVAPSVSKPGAPSQRGLLVMH